MKLHRQKGVGRDDPKANNDFTWENIERNIPQEYLNYIDKWFHDIDTKILTWNKDTGEIICNSRKVSNSNIVLLLQDTVEGRKEKLKGRFQFYRALAKCNISNLHIPNVNSNALYEKFKKSMNVIPKGKEMVLVKRQVERNKKCEHKIKKTRHDENDHVNDRVKMTIVKNLFGNHSKNQVAKWVNMKNRK